MPITVSIHPHAAANYACNLVTYIADMYSPESNTLPRCVEDSVDHRRKYCLPWKEQRDLSEISFYQFVEYASAMCLAVFYDSLVTSES
jgi:hypothetical protein